MKFCRIYILILVCFIFSQNIVAQVAKPGTEFEKALEFYKKRDFRDALSTMQNASKKDRSQIGGELVVQGLVFADSVSSAAGIPYFEKAEKILLPDLANGNEICQNYYGLGLGYFRTGEFKSSIKYFMHADYYCAKYGLIREQRNANYYLGINYQKLKKLAIANNYLKKSLELSLKLKDSVLICSSYYSIASSFIIRSYEDTTFVKYGDSIFKIVKEFEKYVIKGNNNQLFRLYDLYSVAYSFKNNYRQALRCSKQALKFTILLRDTINIQKLYITVGVDYYRNNDYDSAIFYTKNAELLNKSPKVDSDHREIYTNLYLFYKAKGDIRSSFKYLEEYVIQNNDINAGIQNQDLQQLREDFETQKTDQKIASEKEKSEALFAQKRNFYLYIAGGIVVTLLLLSYLIYYRFKTKKEKEKKNLQMLLQNAELTALKAQMNPHFIFNALNSIQHSIVTNNTEDAYRFLSKFSKLIRNILDSSSEQLIPLKTEIETLSLYVDIESKRFDNSFSFKINLNENGFSAEKATIPPMILQPFIENAIWHGLMPKENEKDLNINFTLLSTDSLVCEITDNGIGREKAKQIALEKKKTHRSKGIANIMDRIKLIELTHSVKIAIETADLVNDAGSPIGTKVTAKFIKLNPQ